MRPVEVQVVCEGHTESTFVREILAPHLGSRNLFLHAPILGRPGQKGGNVQFERVTADVGRFLKQRSDVFVTTMLDFFGLDRDWPGLQAVYDRRDARQTLPATEIGEILESATLDAMVGEFPDLDIQRRFLPYIQVHEFEAILFSDPAALAGYLSIPLPRVQEIVDEFDTPEEINDGPTTAPSKRLTALSRGYGKVTMGITIAREIGLDQIRERCGHFDAWVSRLESLTHV